MTRTLITGINGQLGQELQRVLSSVANLELIGVGRDRMDLSQPSTIRSIVAEIQPEIIINSGAYTAVDKAESEPELAHAINGIAPGILAEEAQKLDATLIHVSTDYVFDGTQSHPYQETDPTHPIGIYGASKLAGEQAIQATNARAIILRTAWVYGVGGTGNFVKTMLRLGADRPELRVVADQIGSPTWTGDIANAIAGLIAQHRDLSGIYHFTNSGVASWYDFAVAIFEEAAQLGFPLKIDRVVPITTPEYPTPAKRPAYSVLAGQKIASVLESPAPHWRYSLRKMLAELKG
ncbi:MAG TPA: dTDP-4-dehydrorhamnose reductase [Oscillatoriales cyanobacterium M59_W2019_021]|nr:dTDP-4-dehydrorhamnose reductase [Oscillatoriales cyanobacterium M4454_W2019_049]HIK52773.1 dTDP-4-dehydrorhamnose reductase [Oscillatoriales cyanobacterium M59_W2019_021]